MMATLASLALIAAMSVGSGSTTYMTANISYSGNESSNETVQASTNALSTTNISTMSTLESGFDGFSYLGGFPEKALVINYTYGYVYYNLSVYKASYTNHSNLYLVFVQTEFTPGYVAYANGDTWYGPNYKLFDGYVHLAASKYVVSSSAHGSNLLLKEFWPQSSTFITTITSSYGGTATYNSSIQAGVTLDGGATITGTSGTSLSFSFNRSIGVTTTDPYLSSQSDPDNVEEAQWNYTATSDAAKQTTYYLKTFYLFEMDNFTFANVNSDAFDLTYTVYMRNAVKILGQYVKWSHTAEVTLGCFH